MQPLGTISHHYDKIYYPSIMMTRSLDLVHGTPGEVLFHLFFSFLLETTKVARNVGGNATLSGIFFSGVSGS